MATWFRRLDAEAVTAIRKMAEQGVTQRELARMFSVSLPTINRCINGVTHDDLPTRPHRTQPWMRKGSLYAYPIRQLQSEVETLRRQLNREGNTS